ncbi:MAG: hypothetical protein V4531_08760 [Actinomycetota bacterium]
MTPRDNARFAVVTLVVIGHGVQRLTADNDNALIVYLFIYAFRVPAFALISGYFEDAPPPNSRQMKRVITDILLRAVLEVDRRALAVLRRLLHRLGQPTRYVYLLHSFVLYPLGQTGILGRTPAPNLLLVAMIRRGIAVSIALASPLVRRVFLPIIEPKPRWLFIELDTGKQRIPAGPSRKHPTGSIRDR